METIFLAAIVVLQLVVVGLLVRTSSFGVRHGPASYVDVSAKERSGTLPGGGTWAIAAGMGCDPVLQSGVLVLDVRSDQVWVHEVWVRTDHGWVQLQPGAGEGMFRNALVAGIRISALRLWLAPSGAPADESALSGAAGLLVPAAILLARVQRPAPAASHRTVTPPPTS